MQQLSLPIRYYRAHPFGMGMEQPAKAFLGHAEKQITIPLDEIALVLVHIWNEGFPEGTSKLPHHMHPILLRHR